MQGEYNNYTFPLAVAVVLSGNYEDNEDDMEEVVYSGEGGNDILGTKQQIRDQVMERGNLALKVCVIWKLSLCYHLFLLLVHIMDAHFKVNNSFVACMHVFVYAFIHF